MRHEVRTIPPAPRLVRLRPLAAHRWPLLAVGGVMVVLGSLIAWAMFLQSGALLDNEARLARGPTTSVTAAITQVDYPRSFEGRTWDYVHYELTWRTPPLEQLRGTSNVQHSHKVYGACFVPTGTRAVGDQVEALVLDADPNVHCVEGGVLHMHRSWLYAPFWLGYVVVPGALVLLAWLAGMFQLQRVLVHGDVSVGTVREVHVVRWVLPPMLSVAYEFRDHRAVPRHNRHWVRVNGALGRRLAQHVADPRGAPPTLPVLHDRRFPQWNRLLLPQDFLPSPIEPMTLEPL